MIAVFRGRGAPTAAGCAGAANVFVAAVVADADEAEETVKFDLARYARGDAAVFDAEDLGAGDAEAARFGQLSQLG